MKLTTAEHEIMSILSDREYLTKEQLAKAIALAIKKAHYEGMWFREITEDELFSDALSELNY